MNIILEQLLSSPTFNVVTAVIALASAIAAATPTPAPGTFLAKLYALIDFAAINFGKAKDKGE